MSYTRTETLIMPSTDAATPSVKKSKLSLRGFFGTKTKTTPGAPWPNPPSQTVTINDDADKGRACCLPFGKR